MKIIISQPRYLPAINYLNRLANIDTFILLDTVQRQSRGWENRNRLLLNDDQKWVTLPIESSTRALICDTIVKNTEWIENHISIIKNYYKKAPYYNEKLIYDFYYSMKIAMQSGKMLFSEIIMSSYLVLADFFDFRMNIITASSLDLNRENWSKGPEELLRISQLVGSDTYVSGPNGRSYGVKEYFANSNVKVLFHDFNYPVYKHFNSKLFVPYLSFFDPLFNIGKEGLSRELKAKLNLNLL